MRRHIFAIVSGIATGLLLIVTAAPAQDSCIGDCDGDMAVHVDELILGVMIDLREIGVDQYGPLDANNDLDKTVDEIIRAITSALEGCPKASPPTQPSATPTPEPCNSPQIPEVHLVLGSQLRERHANEPEVFRSKCQFLAPRRDPFCGMPVYNGTPRRIVISS